MTKYVYNPFTGKLDANDGAGGGTGNVSSTATITDNSLVRGDGGARNIQDSGILIDDSDNMTAIASITLSAGATIDEFSIDGTLAGDSDTAVPTEKAVKNYVDNFGPGSGDVVGPAAATDNAAARFDTITGKLLQDGVVTIGDTGDLAGIAALSMSGNITVGGTVDGRDLATDGSKLDGIEALADVTDAANVNSAGAVMESDYSAKGDILIASGSGAPAILGVGTDNYVLTADSGEVTGVKWSAAGAGAGDVVGPAASTDNAAARFDSITGKLLQDGVVTIGDTGDLAGIAALSMSGNITVGGTVDGRDLATDGSKLDGVEALADVTDAANVNAAGAVMEADYNANTILAATADNTPAALTVAEQTLVGRITAGNIDALTATEVRTLINVEDGADVTDATNVASAGAVMASTVDAKGDILAGTADNTIGRLALGTNDYVLTADSGEATGLKWAAAGGGGGSMPNKEYWFAAESLQPLETNFAPLEKLEGTNVNVFVRAFDDTTEEYVNGKCQVPGDVDASGTVTFRAYVMAKTAAASKNIAMTFGHLALNDSEDFDPASPYTEEDSGDKAIDATQDDLTEITWTETVSNLGWTANDLVLFRVSRDPGATDDLSGDLYLFSFAIEIPRSA